MADLIDRQAAINALVEELAYKPEGYWDSGLNQYDVEVVLNQQPSAQPEIIRCKDCKHWDISDIHSTICPDNRRCKGIIGKIYTAPDYYCAYGERKDG